MSFQTQVSDLVVRLGTEFKTVYGKIGALPALTTTAKSDLVSAINEVNAATASAGAHINDSAASTTTVYSSSKTDSQIGAAVDALVDGAPGTLDTLNELATALLADGSGITAINLALANRVRFDASQTLTSPQLTQAHTNLGLGTAATSAASAFDAAGAAAAVTAASIGAATAANLTSETNRATTAEGLKLAKASNLSDLANTATARTNLGLGSAATLASTAFDAAGAATSAGSAAVASSLQKSQNLSDVASVPTALANLGVYSQSDIGSITTDFVAAFNTALA